MHQAHPLPLLPGMSASEPVSPSRLKLKIYLSIGTFLGEFRHLASTAPPIASVNGHDGGPVVNIHNFVLQFAVLFAPLLHIPTEQITPTLYRGPDPRVEDIYALHKKGFKTIVSMRTNPQWQKQELCQKLGMKWVHIKTGVFQVPTEQQIDIFRSVVKDPERQPVYCSCEISMDRTGVFLAAHQMADNGWDYQKMDVDFHKHHPKLWWPIFRKYERAVNTYATGHTVTTTNVVTGSDVTKTSTEVTGTQATPTASVVSDQKLD